ncbi:non-homologous end-joining DNA ligase [Williamsia sp. D3]|uniref:non-homologous end-joining DNA ligase n=1 Tax=Williamsia sp. D3 TaxID=1313067 RepID=UPI0003D2C6FB|nr:non-homologous end-joining DNA ligase [Williamsia sp. D3]ETD31625.1 ATP-dependent DNA ligase [Williamsia sp. D3]
MTDAPLPMLATLGTPPAGSGWAYEMKWDGQRAIAVVDSASARLVSRNANDISGSFPELIDALPEAVAGHTVVLDGEIVALDDKGRPSFARLQQRMHVLRPSTQLRKDVPTTFYVFDILELDGDDVAGLPYLTRRRLLDDLGLESKRVRVPPIWTEVDGETMLDIARQNGLEGVVAKKIDSVYRPGRRSPAWIKTPLRSNTEVVVGGWVPGSGAASGGIGSLLLGAHNADGELVYIGHVGTGFSSAMRRELLEMLSEIETSTPPFAQTPPRAIAKDAHWVTPKYVGDVEYREFTGKLRHPSWKGLRDDKSPADVDWPGDH